MEAPEYVADPADEACETAYALVRAYDKATVMGLSGDQSQARSERKLHGRLLERITAFPGLPLGDYLDGQSHRT